MDQRLGADETTLYRQLTVTRCAHFHQEPSGPAFSKCCPNARLSCSTRAAVCTEDVSHSVLMKHSRS